MKLYHGTTEAAARAALTEGLRPRGFQRGNWDVESCPDHVYLTTAYAGYFALCAADEGERWGIVEVDLDYLDMDLMRPDEDCLEQCTRMEVVVDHDGNTAPRDDMVARTAWFRERIDQFANTWWVSLDHLGTCAYKGVIPPEAITRVSIYDPKSNPSMTMTAADPMITPINYQIMGGKYRALTQWLMGDDIDAAALFTVAGLQMPIDRDMGDLLHERRVEVLQGVAT